MLERLCLVKFLCSVFMLLAWIMHADMHNAYDFIEILGQYNKWQLNIGI